MNIKEESDEKGILEWITYLLDSYRHNSENFAF